jgi:hypothetical protein
MEHNVEPLEIDAVLPYGLSDIRVFMLLCLQQDEVLNARL